MKISESAKRVKKFLAREGFKRVSVECGAILVYDEGGHVYSLVEWEISQTSDNLRIKVCSLYDMANNYAQVKALHGRII
jgi:hypothetical protein